LIEKRVHWNTYAASLITPKLTPLLLIEKRVHWNHFPGVVARPADTASLDREAGSLEL